MMQQAFVSDEELHAYIDGGLDPARRLSVAIYLATHPGEAARSEAFRAQKEGIRALFDHVLDQPVPDELRELTLRHGARSARRRIAWALAAASLVAGLALGGRALQDRVGLLVQGDAQQDTAQAPARPAGTLFAPDPAAYPPAPRRQTGI